MSRFYKIMDNDDIDNITRKCNNSPILKLFVTKLSFKNI